MASAYYSDEFIVCDSDGITLKFYYPFGLSKRISWSRIRAIHEKPLSLLDGKFRIWGMGLKPTWFGFDTSRVFKNKYIEIDTGKLVKAAVTPARHEEAMAVMREYLGPVAA